MADMQIFVKTGALPHGVVHGPITMTVDDVKPSDTIAKVKAKIQALTAFPATEQHLFLGRQELDSLRTLADHDIQNESTLHMTVSGRLMAQLRREQILMKTMTVDDVKLSDNIAKVEAKIQALTASRTSPHST